MARRICIPVEPTIVQPTAAAAVEEAAAQAGADHVEKAERDRRSLAEPVSHSRRLQRRCFSRVPSTIRRQQALAIGRTEGAENSGLVPARAEVTEGEVGLRRIGDAVARQLEVEPILAVHGARRARSASGRWRRSQASCTFCWQAFTPVPVVSSELRRVGRILDERLRIAAARESSHSQPGATGSPALSITPGAAALGGDADGDLRLRRQVRHLSASCRSVAAQSGPGPLADPARSPPPAMVAYIVRQRDDGDLLAPRS